MSEFDLIRWMRERASMSDNVVVGIGDDTAVLPPGSSQLLITTDMLLEGSHFLLAKDDPERVGRKAMSVNLSDIAAMAGQPQTAVVSVGLPRSGSRSIAEKLYAGLRSAADAFETTLVGGDTNSWAGGLVISVTVIGQVTGTGAVLRNGAQPGDWLIVSGELGGSQLGKHFDFTPRVREAQHLHQLVSLHAMIDLSDGLSSDLGHICKESGCGAVVFANAIPTSDAAAKIGDDRTPLMHALSDGEDFELLFAVSPQDGQRLIDHQPLGSVRLSHIGECTAEEQIYLQTGSRKEVLNASGYIHQF